MIELPHHARARFFGGQTLGVQLGALLAQGVGFAVQAHELGAQLGKLRVQQVQLVLELHGALFGPLALRFHVALGLARLNLERTHPRAQLAHDVLHALHVLGDALEAQLGFMLALAIAAGAGGLFEDGPALLGVGGQDGVDAALLQDRVTPAAQTRVEQHVLDVLQAAAGAVEQVLALTVLVQTPRDSDFRAAAFQLLLLVVEHQGHLGHLQGRAAGRALEDHVGHARTPHGGRAGFAEHPAHGVHHVGLAAAVRTDDAGQAIAVEVHHGAIREGLEAEEFEAFEMHGR